MKQLPKNNENLSVFENDKLELSEMDYLRGGGIEGDGDGEDTGDDPPSFP